MVTSVSSLPYFSYLDQLQGKGSAVQTVPTPVTQPSVNNNESPSLVSSLLGQGGFAPSVLSLLQENGGKFDPIANILGGKSVNNGTTKLYTNIYDNAAAASLQQAKLDNPKAAPATTSASFSLISGAITASKAYNKTLQQNAAATLAQGKAQTLALIS
jgi:hypothetical protein